MTAPVRHICHHPDCTTPVPPKVLACKPHWFELPKSLRDQVWLAYRPRQEVTKTPSVEYLEIIREVMAYWRGERPEE